MPIKALTRSSAIPLYHVIGGVRITGPHGGLRGDVGNLRGDVSGLSGYVSGLSGDVSGLSGDVSGLSGNISGLSGNIDDCMVPDEERVTGVDIATLVEQ